MIEESARIWEEKNNNNNNIIGQAPRQMIPFFNICFQIIFISTVYFHSSILSYHRTIRKKVETVIEEGSKDAGKAIEDDVKLLCLSPE